LEVFPVREKVIRRKVTLEAHIAGAGNRNNTVKMCLSERDIVRMN
jgi:hypothetical protein